jgi:uncharacterized membrane protein YhhN
MLIVPTIICVIALVVLVAGEYKHTNTLRVIAKPIASLAFVALGLFTITSCEPSVAAWDDYQRYIVIGLVLGMAGDIALLGKSNAAFLAGLSVFLLGHIAYIVAFAQLAPPNTWASAFALVPIAVAGIALRLLWPKLGTMRVPVIAYVLTIVTMMIAAFAAAKVEVVPERNRSLLLVGAALFFASDLAVARDKFVGASFVNRAWGLPTYYAGQLLIAWSMWLSLC